MKRYFAIILHDRRRFEIALERIMPDVPAYVRCNDPKILRAAAEISIEGFCPDDQVQYPRWIAGSCIRHIDIVFEEHSQWQVKPNIWDRLRTWFEPFMKYGKI